MSFYIPTNYKGINLQSTLASATADSALAGDIEGTHHPITCTTGDIYLDEDLSMRCNHCKAPYSNPRNQAIIDATIALLIFEEAYKKFG